MESKYLKINWGFSQQGIGLNLTYKIRIFCLTITYTREVFLIMLKRTTNKFLCLATIAIAVYGANGYGNVSTGGNLFTPELERFGVLSAKGPNGSKPLTNDMSQHVDFCNVVWDSPSENALGSMPLGNGDIAANVWVEPSGDLVLLISKTDAYDGFARLLKIGRVRIKISPPSLNLDKKFRQALNLREGCIDIQVGTTKFKIWVDANHPVLQVDYQSDEPISVSSSIEIWRTELRKLDRKIGKMIEITSAYGNPPDKCMVHPDTVLPSDTSSIAVCHHNKESIWKSNLENAGLTTEIQNFSDPLLGRAFGLVIRGTDMKPSNDLVLESTRPSRSGKIQMTTLTKIVDSPVEWRKAANDVATSIPVESNLRWEEHRIWWRDFWQRGWIFISEITTATDNARLVTQSYALQRFISACAGRGHLPIKFNGSLFTVDEFFDPDFRQWGGPYWLQNTRLIYWPMLHSGDHDLMLPLFKMYKDMLPLRKVATSVYFGHQGAYYPETTHFWGNYTDINYGFNRGKLPPGISQNKYIRYHWVGILEIVTMMLDYYDYTQNATFRDETLIPLAVETLRFYDQHWKRGEDGKIKYMPSQALESYFDTENPVPDIAAVRYLIPRLMDLPIPLVIRENWIKQLADQPELPGLVIAGKNKIAPAEKYGKKSNSEVPEYYAVFPFRLYSLANESDQRVKFSFDPAKDNRGWQQGPIWNAMLGFQQQAQSQVVDRVKVKAKGYRFPGFYGPNFDWTPDQCQMGVFQMALQQMLMQCEGDKILLFPAWPSNWDVNFKLHAPKNTTIECVVKGGKVVKLIVNPEYRLKDVRVVCGQK